MSKEILIELTGDEERLLRSFRRAEAEEQKLSDGLGKSGREGEQAGKRVADAMVKLGKAGSSSLNSIMKDMKATGSEGRKVASTLEGHWRDHGIAGRQSVDSIIERIQKLDPVSAEIARKAVANIKEASAKDAFANVRRSLSELGPEGAAVAKEVGEKLDELDRRAKFARTLREFRALGEEGQKQAKDVLSAFKRADEETKLNQALMSMRKLSPAAQQAATELERSYTRADERIRFAKTLRQLRELGPIGREQAKEIRDAMRKADQQSEFDKTINELESIGDEAAVIARGVRKELKTAAKDSAESMNAVLQKLERLDPEAAESARKIKQELAEAAQSSESKLEAPLRKLRELGPVGKKVADEIESELRGVGRVGRESIGDIIDEIRKIDPAMADAASKAHKHLDNSAADSSLSFREFGRTAVAQITSMIGAYAGVQEAVDFLIQSNEKLRDTNRHVLDDLKSQAPGQTKLLQVATDEQDFKQLRANADRLAKTYGLGREAAKNLVFSGRSEGFEKDLDYIVAGQQVVNIESAARVAGQTKELFKGEDITSRQAINATLAGAELSRLSFGEISKALPQAAEGGAIAGAKADETIASLSVLASRFKSADTAADRLKAFATKVGIDEGETGTTAEELKSKTQAERERVEREKRSYRSKMERVRDTQRRIADLQADQPTTAKGEASQQRRLRDLQTTLARAEREVKEFDRSKLQFQQPTVQAARGSLAGLGIIRAVEGLQALSDEQRKGFLGDSQELNTAYRILVDEMPNIKMRREAIRSAIDRTDTDKSVLKQKIRIAESDPQLRTLKREAIAKTTLEVSREQNRAISEAQRQIDTAKELTSAENAGVSQFRIASAEVIAEKVEGFTGNAPADTIRGVTAHPLANLERDLSLAASDGDETVYPALLAVNKLRRSRVDNADALLSKSAAAEYLSSMRGVSISPRRITDEMRSDLTESIDLQASRAMGLMSNTVVTVSDSLGVPLVGGAVKAAIGDGSVASGRIFERFMAEQNELLRELNTMVKEQNEREKRKETQPPKRDPIRIPPNVGRDTAMNGRGGQR